MMSSPSPIFPGKIYTTKRYISIRFALFKDFSNSRGELGGILVNLEMEEQPSKFIVSNKIEFMVTIHALCVI
jgi:hypothetical protein